MVLAAALALGCAAGVATEERAAGVAVGSRARVAACTEPVPPGQRCPEVRGGSGASGILGALSGLVGTVLGAIRAAL